MTMTAVLEILDAAADLPVLVLPLLSLLVAPHCRRRRRPPSPRPEI